VVDQIFLTTSIFAGRLAFMNDQWSVSVHLSPIEWTMCPVHAVVPQRQWERWRVGRIMWHGIT